MNLLVRLTLLIPLLFSCPTFILPAFAYIGPGAGIAFFSSFLFIILAFILAIILILTLPFRLITNRLVRKRSKPVSGVDRVIILGLDGLDPKLTEKFMDQGKLPHFKRLQEMGSYSHLATSYPAISPVAWSSFMTGVDCSYHNIFDFITRDPKTYLPELSSAKIVKETKKLLLGDLRAKFTKPKVKLLRRSKPFWTILGENNIFSYIIRVPITYPPEKFNGVLLSGMCAPDIRGTQGTFSYYTATHDTKQSMEGGIGFPVGRRGNTINTYLYGPQIDIEKNGQTIKVPLSITIDESRNRAQFKVSGNKFYLEPKTYSPWINIRFRNGLISKVSAICRFYLNELKPNFNLYVTPLQVNPESPAIPISHPLIYSVYLAKLMGSYGTLGLAEDTWALNDGIIDEDSFLKQAYLYYKERENMLFNSLERKTDGLCVCVFDTPDRIQHMFYRYLEENHPANKGNDAFKFTYVIEELYRKMDQLVGKTMERLDDKTILIVMSDHGFSSFRRGFNINTWLFQNGYLALKRGKTTSGDWFSEVDWQRTKVYSLGLACIFINKKGREGEGIVEDGDYIPLKNEIRSKLKGLVDSETEEVAITDVVDTRNSFSGPYIDNAPDLMISYNVGYRTSWGCAKGRVTETIFDDNNKKWSGDHCIDPKLVPGILFCNRTIASEYPDIRDIAPTVLKLLGVKIPAYMEGNPLIEN